MLKNVHHICICSLLAGIAGCSNYSPTVSTEMSNKSNTPPVHNASTVTNDRMISNQKQNNTKAINASKQDADLAQQQAIQAEMAALPISETSW